MRFRSVLAMAAAGAIALAGSGCSTAPTTAATGGATVATETFMVPAADPGIQLHVRNKHPAGVTAFAPEHIALFVHGATYPSETGFDINLPGGSWLD